MLACYRCFRSGRLALKKDTELGMMRHEEALRGVTHGMPGLNRADFDVVPLDDGWVAPSCPSRPCWNCCTPPATRASKAQWLFCCKGPMAYIGQWSRQKFTEMAPDGNGRAFFGRVVRNTIAGLREDKLHDVTAVYVFRCPRCHAYSAHWDMF